MYPPLPIALVAEDPRLRFHMYLRETHGILFYSVYSSAKLMNSWASSHTRAVGVAGGGPANPRVPVKQQHRLY